MYDRLNAKGLKSSLLTGQERREVDGATHKSSTVEMTDLDMQLDVAVIDEIQMIGDEFRVWVWIHAFLCVQAKVCFF